MKFQTIHARDWIAILFFVGAFYLKLRGIDGTLDTLVALIVGYYFSKRVYEENVKKDGDKTQSPQAQ